MSNEEKIFADGFKATRNPSAPDFVICALSVNVESARETFKNHTKNGWLNLQVKLSKGGKYYVEVDTWEPSQQSAPQQAPQQAAPQSAPADENFDDDIPF